MLSSVDGILHYCYQLGIANTTIFSRQQFHRYCYLSATVLFTYDVEGDEKGSKCRRGRGTPDKITGMWRHWLLFSMLLSPNLMTLSFHFSHFAHTLFEILSLNDPIFVLKGAYSDFLICCFIGLYFTSSPIVQIVFSGFLTSHKNCFYAVP